MRFLVICRAIEPPPVGYPDQLELVEAIQERLRSRTDTRIVDVLSFAGERAFAIVVDASTGRTGHRSVIRQPRRWRITNGFLCCGLAS